MKNTIHQIARTTSFIFHPLMVPTLGFFLLLNSGFYFSILPWNVKKFMLLVVFLTTCLLPALSILMLSLSPKFDMKMVKNNERILPMLISSFFYFLGYLILKRIPVSPIYNFFLIASILVQISLIVISFQWKISIHSAAIGGLIGAYIGISFRLHQNPFAILISLVLIAGLVGTSRLILEKHTSAQVYAGFLVGLLIMNSVILFI